MFVVAGVVAGSGLATAQGLVQYEFAGTVTDDTGNLGVFGTPLSVDVGNPFTGRFSYLTGLDNSDQSPSDATVGQYALAGFEIDQSIVPLTPLRIVVQHDPGLPPLDPMAPPPGFDAITFAATFPDGMLTRIVSLYLEAPFSAVFADDSLPTGLTLSAFTDEQQVRAIRVIGLMGGESQIDAGQVTSLVQVPEPGAAWLALLAVSAMRRLQWRLMS
jgi:hypothetical protein